MTPMAMHLSQALGSFPAVVLPRDNSPTHGADMATSVFTRLQAISGTGVTAIRQRLPIRQTSHHSLADRGPNSKKVHSEAFYWSDQEARTAGNNAHVRSPTCEALWALALNQALSGLLGPILTDVFCLLLHLCIG